MSQRKSLPRVEIRKSDELPGRYPSVQRTGDPSRRGALPVFFNDTNTIVYDNETSASISWPSTLPIFGSIVGDFTSSIVTSGKTNKSSVGDLNNVRSFVEPATPFDESSQPEQVETTDEFYMTGTNVEAVGFGMSSKLKSKVMIRIKLPLAAGTRLRGAQASVYYYNKSTHLFEEVAPNEIGPATDVSDIRTTYPAMDSKMFGPFGNFVVSGAANVRFYGVKSGSQINSSLIESLQQSSVTGSSLSDPRYKPTSQHRIKLSDYIAHPFVIEKAVLEAPMTAGQTWFEDITQFMPNGPFDNVPDAGGPCVTFSLLGVSANGDKRDLIMSGTVIPTGDDIVSSITFTSGADDYMALCGFRSFAKPATVLTPGSDGTFTGSAIVRMTANVRNSIYSYGAPAAASYRSWQAFNFGTSYIGMLDPYGRGSSNDSCGRSIFGKEYTTPQIDNLNIVSLNRKLLGAPPTNVSYYPEIYAFDSNVPSPYLVFPKDELVVTVSKHRPVISVDLNYTSYNVPTSSHDVSISSGSVFITLFGSLLRNGAETDDSHNPPATSEVVHEIIGNEPIYDEYDVFYKDELRDTYITDYVSGSIFANDNSARGRWRSSLDSNATVRLRDANRVSEQRKFIYHLVSFRRYAEANSNTERFYDSLVPPINDIISRGRYYARLYAWPLFGTTTREVIVLNLDSNDYAFGYYGHVSNDWSRAFPFEPTYSGLTRSTIQRFYARNILSSLWYYHFWGRYYTLEDNIVVKVGTSPYQLQVGIDQINPGAERIGLKNDVAMKLIYGIGDFNNCYNYVNKTYGAVDRPRMIENVFTNSYAGVEIRGWKYGLINGTPQHTKTIWRRDKYGQYRDMLEQRLDTKFFLTADAASQDFFRKSSQYTSDAPIVVRFLNLSGTIVRPEETLSSNLSYEATSSLPYFDGLVRNRENPLLVYKIQKYEYLS